MKRSLLPVLALVLAGVASPPVEVHGYGPWQLGMTREQVAAATAHGPYSPVTATGGLETRNAQFQGSQITASFVFGPHGLRHIQLWAYEGQDREKALRAFHGVYGYLSEQLGPLHSDGTPIPRGISEDSLTALVPPAFKTGTVQSQLSELPKRGSIQAQVHKFHLHPQTPAVGAEVYGSLIHSPQLGMYWVFVYFKSLPHDS